MDLSLDEVEQNNLKENHLKIFTREIRNEFNYFNSYEYQWYYEQFKTIKDGYLLQVTTKAKSKAVFVSINNMSKKYFKLDGKKIEL